MSSPGLVVIELDAGNAGDQGSHKRLALNQRQGGDITAVEMQKIERVVDELHSAFAIARGLGLRKARQSVVANPA